MASHTDPNATAPTPPLPQLRHLGVSRLQGTDVVIFAIAAGFLFIAGVLNAIGIPYPYTLYGLLPCIPPTIV